SRRRTSVPSGVPPGSRRQMCEMPRRSNRAESRRSCVVLPEPSPPSNTISRPVDAPLVIQSSQRDDRARGALLDAIHDPIVHLRHDLVKVLLRRNQTLIHRLALHLAEQGVQLALHLLGWALSTLNHLLRAEPE